MSKVSKTNTKSKSYESRKVSHRTSNKTRTLTHSKLFDTGSKGTGKYIKATQPISKRAYKLEASSLKNERLAINSKPDVIKAAGQALAMNITPSTASYAAGLGLSSNQTNRSSASNSHEQINNLVNGGLNQAGTMNEEELDATYNPR